jgi:hypothetical protein
VPAGTIVDFGSAFVAQILKAILKPEAAAATKACPYCLENVPVDAKKCRACTSPI